MTDTAKTAFYWVRVGNGEPEPAAVTGEKPNRKATTFGCPDTFNVDDPASGCSIVMLCNQQPDPRFSRPREAWISLELDLDRGFRELTVIEAAVREKAYQRAIKIKPHSYAGFGRRS